MAKIGDTVRFLNAVGGGKIVRMEGRIAYVCDPVDGFETPVDINECVVVPSAVAGAAEIADSTVPDEKPLRAPVKETAAKELTAALLFEPRDIKRLSQTSFDVYLVNDSNYRLLYAVSARPTDASEFTLLAAGEAEPNVQVFIDEINQLDINSLAVISVQLVAFKADRSFELRAPIASETRMDLSRLAKLHCFTSTAYSEAPVLTVPIVTNGVTARPLRLEQLIDRFEPTPEEKPAPAPKADRAFFQSLTSGVVLFIAKPETGRRLPNNCTGSGFQFFYLPKEIYMRKNATAFSSYFNTSKLHIQYKQSNLEDACP